MDRICSYPVQNFSERVCSVFWRPRRGDCVDLGLETFDTRFLLLTKTTTMDETQRIAVISMTNIHLQCIGETVVGFLLLT